MRGVIRGDIEIQATVWPFVNSVVIKGLDRGGEFWMSFFVDADELDYVEALVAGDLVADFGALWDHDTGTDPIDLQPCGGTHVARTGEIGRVSIGKIEKKGRQNRRVSITLLD
jgi:hypothetical protein